MSFTEAAKQIARRDARERLALATNRQSATEILDAAERRGDSELAYGIRQEIAERWPLRKPINYAPRLTLANAQILNATTGAWADAAARRARQDYTEHKFTREIFDRTYPPLVAGYVQTIDDVQAAALEERDKASKVLATQVSKLLAKPGGSVEEQLLYETQAQRAWARLRPQLENLSDSQLVGSVERLVADATGAGERGALVEELPAYMSSRGMDRHFGGTPLTTVVQDALVQSDPMAIAADKAETRADEYFTIVRHNATHMRTLITDGWAELHTMTMQDLHRIAEGRSGRFITVNEADLNALTDAEAAAATISLINI